MMWLSGFLIAYAIGRYRVRCLDEQFTHTALAIWEGWAEPDGAGRIGWGRPYNDGRHTSAYDRGTEAGLKVAGDLAHTHSELYEGHREKRAAKEIAVAIHQMCIVPRM